MSNNGPSQEIGAPIPSNTPHAVSVTLPTWEATVGYEEGEDWVVNKMSSGYPRFFIHSVIQDLANNIEAKYGREGERCMVFPSYSVAKRCREFVKAKSDKSNLSVRILQLSTAPPEDELEKSSVIESNIGVIFFPSSEFPLAKNYWQHSGEGISSRMGEYVLKEIFHKEKKPSTYKGSHMKQELQAQRIQQRSPSLSKSLQSPSFSSNEETEKEFNTFIEQKYGRVLDLKFAAQAKVALRRRICGKIDKSHSQEDEMQKARRGKHLSETDVYLYPSGMAAIFNAHHALLQVAETKNKSVCFGFPYVDTLNILKKFGPGVHFFGFGDDESLEDMESQLKSGEIKITALFCECPSNPLLKTPNLKKIRELADEYNFAVVIDETVGNFVNIHVLPYADIVASSLTKVFSGDSNVMAGSLILNPESKMYHTLKKYFDDEYEDLFWAEDALYLERNSRDFAERSAKINETALATVDLLQQNPLISKVYYPSISDTKHYYDAIKTPNGGYGGLISFIFKEPEDAICFFNAVNLHKGPSLGTNFTLACPYAILAHYQELDEIAKWDIDRNLIRISIGLESESDLLGVLNKSLKQAAAQH
ncbi:DEHA2D09350p [Debaryomyces hansenii CBS767]|uniref:cystathionine gamma-synthase n=1 Tax=Debaryomyces hansenii (strain ATCC 36239 / CBS 767 / BCRC 21394 / JCM 1990 / NBRC 0083 / IGC 2968) TaxID=284592 RepID=Q6BSE9_DEBHA|nr:DEHA2D09350p [Debaryomyces hansenii CBS767]CAG87023.2 DEHA2D09350p [Debaryomyces hansenii CBS767]|eukprot:XP_458871.2 DEHA2D09350p [Debaryomyces hansenii CBS767]